MAVANLENVPNASEQLLTLLKLTEELADGIQTALRGIGGEPERLGVSPWTSPASSRPRACPELDSLSPRESEIVQLLMEGRRVSSIAKSLCISPHTVRSHLQSTYRKLEVGSQAELIDKLKAPPGLQLVPAGPM
jgi:DNA-binding CsgD family transcriptional regulator